MNESFQLRYLQTLNGIAAEHNSTIVFPVPIDILSNFMSAGQNSGNNPGIYCNDFLPCWLPLLIDTIFFLWTTSLKGKDWDQRVFQVLMKLCNRRSTKKQHFLFVRIYYVKRNLLSRSCCNIYRSSRHFNFGLKPQPQTWEQNCINLF